MKNIRSVFILLIGMISLTAFATTSKLDQKPTTALTTDHSICIEAVNVDYTFQVVSVPVNATFSEIIINDFSQRNFQSFLAIVTDVGWQSGNLSFEQIEYTKAFQTMDGFFKWGSDVMATWNRK